jgi:hypothetical protein
VILRERARAVADAILYEGYALYPYRASSVKNRQRWMLGSLSPRGVADARGEPWRLRCACLLEAAEGAEIEALARFLRFEAGAAWDEATPEARSPEASVASASCARAWKVRWGSPRSRSRPACTGWW